MDIPSYISLNRLKYYVTYVAMLIIIPIILFEDFIANIAMDIPS